MERCAAVHGSGVDSAPGSLGRRGGGRGSQAAAWLRPWLLVAGCWCAAWVAAAADAAIPTLSARVTDLAGVLGEADRSALEARLAAFERERGAQVAVLVVRSTGDEAIEAYALRVAEQTKLGRRGVDDGALLLVAVDDRRLRIEVGYGLEGVLTDATSNRIIDEYIVPRLRTGDYAGGIRDGVERMLAVIGGEALPPPAPRAGQPVGNPYLIALFLAFFFAAFFRGRGRLRPGRALLGSAASGLLTLGLTGILAAAGVSAVAAVILAAVLGQMGPPGGWASGGRRGGYFPGGWYPGGRHGGFGGGGGGFGGGGASGHW